MNKRVNRRIFDIPAALQSLRPGCSWSVMGDTHEGIIWTDTEIDCPTKEEIDLEISRLQKQEDANFYKKQREVEYPNFIEYLDGMVKGDQEQMQAYIDSCLAIKNKYPKP
jgi:hypothetical protein